MGEDILLTLNQKNTLVTTILHQMTDHRYFHACGKFMLGDQTVLIVAGQDQSVEFLPFNETNWINGPNLPFDPHGSSHFIVSKSDKLYFIDTYLNQFLELVCT